MSGEKQRQKFDGLVKRWQAAVLWKHFLFRSKKTDGGRAYQKELELCGKKRNWILLLLLIKWNGICWFHFYFQICRKSQPWLKSFAMNISMIPIWNLCQMSKSGSVPTGNVQGHLTFKSLCFIPCLLHFPIDVNMEINSTMWL